MSTSNVKRERDEEDDGGDHGQDQYDEATYSRESIPNIKRERDGEDDDDQDQYDEATHSREESIPNVKRERGGEDDCDQGQDHDQYDEATHSRASKRSRIRSTAHEMHAVENDAETLMEGAACTRKGEEYQI